MKSASCYNCSSQQHDFYAEENGFVLAKCRECGLLFVENPPAHNEISESHEQGQHGGVKGFNVTGRYDSTKVPRYLSVLDDIFNGDLGQIRTWLDVGCGHGEFIEAVQRYGAVSVSGTEPNVRKQQSARSRGLSVGFYDLESHRGRYDAVSMLNVYSHLPNPPAFLTSIRKLLNPRGELILETGDTADFSAKDHVRPLYLPDHLSFASESIVVRVLEQSGFEIISVHKFPFFPLRLRSIAKELGKALLPQYRSQLRYYVRGRTYSRADMFIRAKRAG